jgi:hypothetical protein
VKGAILVLPAEPQGFFATVQDLVVTVEDRGYLFPKFSGLFQGLRLLAPVTLINQEILTFPILQFFAFFIDFYKIIYV